MARSSSSKKTQNKRSARREKRAKQRKAAIPRLTAATADKFELYQLAVQSPEDDVEFLEGLYTTMRGESPRGLREDFCGTAAVCARWLQRHPENTAEGFDIDPEPVAWGKEHNFEPIGEAAERMTFQMKDVREPSEQPPDLRIAMNFSYCCFKKRSDLLEYFRAVYEDLDEKGVFVLDVHGGPECYEEMEEERPMEGGARYVWEQAEYWPATGEYRCNIHFEFRDKTSLQNAFEYDWRLWSLPELVDCLEEVGFGHIQSYWEGDDEDGEGGNGEFEPDPKGENCLSWIAYVVASRS